MAETLPDEVAQEVIGYVRHQAAKTPADLVALIERGRAYVDSTLDGVSETQARICPEPGEWCICDVLHHVSASMHGNARIVEALMAGKAADLKGIEPVLEGGRETLAVLRREAAKAFEDLQSTIAAMPSGTASSLKARHPFFGDLTAKEWAAFAYVHARDHGMQIEKVKASEAFLQQ